MRLLVNITILVTLGLQAGCNSKISGGPDFSQYPNSRAFRANLEAQTDSVRNLQREGHLLRITCYYDSKSPICVRYFVKTNGISSNDRYLHGAPLQDRHWVQLNKKKLAMLQAALAALPPQDDKPRLDRLTILSYQEGVHWITRVFDRLAPPEALARIYEIIGERAETKISAK